jgi:tetratricopeptide (TPR) repeat protein
LEQVLRRSLSPKSQGKRLAVIGEPGSGKTTLLQQMALWVAQEIENSISIWISLADLQGQDLESYLFNTWLRSVFRTITLPKVDYIAMENSFKALLASGNVFIFLDGVDEMSNSQGLANPLREIGSQIEQAGCLVHTRIIISCRLNLWDNEFYTLQDFDVFKTLSFSYPDQVEHFIHRYFLPFDASAEQQQGSTLCSQLRQQSNHRVQELVRNPLCLTLLCWNWFHQDRKNHLPDTKAGLYSQFVESLYRWESDGKKYKLSVTSQQLKQLTKKIGLLARYCWENESTRFRFPEDLLARYLGDASDEHSFLNLVLKLGWINKIGEDANNERKFVYAFFHPSFTEYFAALSIEDSRFFFNHIPWNPNHRKASYRIFDSQWREVYLLWLGREELKKRKRLRLINALISFRDGWQGYYQHQAFFLATLGAKELNHTKKYNYCINQVVRWSLFDNSHLTFNGDRKNLLNLSYAIKNKLKAYEINEQFLARCEIAWETPTLWKDKQTIARASQKFLKELGIDLYEQDDSGIKENMLREAKIIIKKDEELRFPQIIFSNDEHLPIKVQKNSERLYHKQIPFIIKDKPVDSADISQLFPTLVSFLKEVPTGIVRFPNSTLILDWKHYVEFLIQQCIENEFFSKYLCDILLSFTELATKKNGPSSAKLNTLMECLREISPAEYKIEIFLRLLKHICSWEHNKSFEKTSTHICLALKNRCGQDSNLKYGGSLTIESTYSDMREHLVEYSFVSHELLKILQSDDSRLALNELNYGLWLDIIKLILQNDITADHNNLDFTNDIMLISRCLLGHLPQTDLILFSIYKDSYSPKNIEIMLNSIPVNFFSEYTLNFIKGRLLDPDLEVCMSYYYLLFSSAPKIPSNLLIKSFASIQFNASIQVLYAYIYLARDIKLFWQVDNLLLSRWLIHTCAPIAGFNLISRVSDLLIYFWNFLIIVLTRPLAWPISLLSIMFLNTRKSHVEIQAEIVYYRLIRRNWQYLDALSRKTMTVLMERMANTAKWKSKALNNRGTGIKAFCLLFILLAIPPISQLANQSTVLLLELAIHYYSKLINRPEVYLLYLEQFDPSQLKFTWLQQAGVNFVVLMLIMWILQPDKDLVQEIISYIRNTRLNFFRGHGINCRIRNLINLLYSHFSLFDQRNLVLSLRYIEDGSQWHSLSDINQVRAVNNLIEQSIKFHSKARVKVLDTRVKAETVMRAIRIREVSFKTLFITSLLLLLLLLTINFLNLQPSSVISRCNYLIDQEPISFFRNEPPSRIYTNANLLHLQKTCQKTSYSNLTSLSALDQYYLSSGGNIEDSTGLKLLLFIFSGLWFSSYITIFVLSEFLSMKSEAIILKNIRKLYQSLSSLQKIIFILENHWINKYNYEFISLCADIEKSLREQRISSVEGFHEIYIHFLETYITSCMNSLFNRFSFLGILPDEKNLLHEYLLCSFYRLNNDYINKSLRACNTIIRQSADRSVQLKIQITNERFSWQDDLITLPLLRYMAQSDDKKLRDDGLHKLLCCGKDLFEARQYEQAITHYTEITNYLRENDAQHRKTIAQALRQCVEKLSLFTNNLDNKKMRLLSFSAMQKVSELEPLELTSDLANAALLVTTYINIDRNDEAISIAKQLDKNNLVAHLILENAYSCSGLYSKAITVSQAFLSNHSIPLLPKVYFLFSLANCYHLKGDYEQAISTLKTIIRIEDDQILKMKYSAYSRLCWIYGDLGDYSTAIVVGEEASSLYSLAELSQFRTEYNNLGVIYLQMQDYDTARKYFKMCAEGYPENWTSRRWLYWIDITMDRLANAKKDIESIIPKRWKPSAEHSSLGLIYFLQGNIDAARREWSCALECCCNHSLQDKLNRIYLQSLLEHPDFEGDMQNLLTSFQPPSSLLEWTILSPVTILSRSSTQLEGINRLVQLIYQYNNRS